MLRAFALGALVGLVLSSASCSQTTIKCLKANCGGCCDVNGDCQKGDQSFACGLDAVTCATCSGAQSCLAGQCVGDGGVGGGTGGSGGAAGGGSGGGAAGGGSGACTALNCATGCCDGDTCRPGNAYSACGQGGAQCVQCPASQACVRNACMAFSCPGCLLNGMCQPGNARAACGTDGGTCVDCGTQSCVAGGICQTTTTCGPANCSGCCASATGPCVDPGSNAQCGNGGSNCMACPSGTTCQSNTCLGGGGGGTGGAGGSGGCSGFNCPTGCCDTAGTCQPGDQQSNCGGLGSACQQCGLGCIGGSGIHFCI